MWEVIPAIIAGLINNPKCGATFASDILKEKYPEDSWAKYVTCALDSIGASEEEMEEAANRPD